MRKGVRVALFLLMVSMAGAAFAAKDVPVPASCTPQVNARFADLIAQNPTRNVDNIMACGVATQKTRVQNGGPHGSHHVTTIAVQLPGGRTVNAQIVTNDELDGPITAQLNDPVFAYGQGYISHGLWAAGIHDTHCSTHPGADNGWVVVAGVKTPKSCPNSR
jgi:hypothetical protein